MGTKAFVGWVCPVCGRGLALWVSCCPCWAERQIVISTSDLPLYVDVGNRENLVLPP